MSQLLGAGIAYYRKKATKWEQRQSQNQQADPQSLQTWVDPQKRMLLANLVSAMYKRGRKNGDCSTILESRHYELIPLTQILTYEEQQRLKKDLEKEAKYKYFGVLRRKVGASNVGPPWVVAIRGTIVTSLHDIYNDIKVSLEQLHTSSTYKLLKVVLLRLSTQYGCSNVAVTGHSLGSAHGMLVTRRLAIQGHALESHFFNPPFAALGAIICIWARKLIRKVLNVAKVEDMIQFRAAYQASLLAGTLGLWLDGREILKQQYVDYKALAGWCPHLYLNYGDPICQQYIPYFTKTRPSSLLTVTNLDTWYSLGSAFFKTAFGDAETFHLIPSAVCCITRSNKLLPVTAHSLENWAKPDVSIVVKEPKLVVELNETTNEYIIFSEQDRLDQLFGSLRISPTLDGSITKSMRQGWMRSLQINVMRGLIEG